MLEIEEAKIELDDKNLKITEYLKREIELKREIQDLTVRLKEIQEEQEEFKNLKGAVEVERLANGIAKLETDSYYRNLTTNTNKDDLIKLLAGMQIKYKKSE